ncbi:acid protease [Tothia fuscella]|uniref:Acid protease n=1 Tax=Tothia fuscella TaxID=1048955 RepID=A0A9P4NNC3_9PEZI|nr:acid protease [Tothia fuscella]
MVPWLSISVFAVLSTLGTCAKPPSSTWSHVATSQKLTLEQVAVTRKTPWSQELRRAYLKYGKQPPAYLDEAIRNYEAKEENTTSIGAKPYYGDMEYLVEVKVGNLNLSLDLDTGSADLWVFSTLQPNSQRRGRPNGRMYDPKGTNAKPLPGHTWAIKYGDGSGANGQVYLESVTIGSITFPHQAIGAASKISSSFSRDPNNDGMLGLAFSRINAISPKPQLTWFDNVKSKLAAPVFTCALKRKQIGTYDFGYIDPKKYKGDITWVDVKQKGGFWDFEATGFQVGNGPVQKLTWDSMADTGTSLWYAPPAVANAYWANVTGATWRAIRGGWTYPCAAKLPDITLIISGNKVTVPAINMNYQTISSTECYGGIQRTEDGDPLHVAGDTFLKNLFVAFEHPTNGQARLGFAQT